MQKAIQILDEIIKEYEWMKTSSKENIIAVLSIKQDAIYRAKSRIQAIQPKVPTITIPEWTVLLGKDEYESLKEEQLYHTCSPWWWAWWNSCNWIWWAWYSTETPKNFYNK